MLDEDQIKTIKSGLALSHLMSDKEPHLQPFDKPLHVMHVSGGYTRFRGCDMHTLEVRQVMEPHQIGDEWLAHYMVEIELTVDTFSDIIVLRGKGSGVGLAQTLALALERAIKWAETDALNEALKAIERDGSC